MEPRLNTTDAHYTLCSQLSNASVQLLWRLLKQPSPEPLLQRLRFAIMWISHNDMDTGGSRRSMNQDILRPPAAARPSDTKEI